MYCCSKFCTIKNAKWEKLDWAPKIYFIIFAEMFGFTVWVSNRYITAHRGRFKESLLVLFIGVVFLQCNVLHSQVIAFKRTISITPSKGGLWKNMLSKINRQWYIFPLGSLRYFGFIAFYTFLCLKKYFVLTLLLEQGQVINSSRFISSFSVTFVWLLLWLIANTHKYLITILPRGAST